MPPPDFKPTKRASVFQKVDRTQLDYSKIPQYEKTQEQMDEIMPILRSNFLTKHLQDKEIEVIARSMQPKSFQDGETIIKYGDTGHLYYILSKGEVNVHIYEKDADPADPEIETKLALLKPLQSGIGFGELALLYGDKRSATIKSNGYCETYVLDGILFKQMIVQSSIQKRQNLETLLGKIKLFESLDRFQKLKIVDGLQQIVLNKNDFVIKEGDDGKEFFIIEEGDVDCLKLHQIGNKKGFVLVRQLTSGDHFGEIALIKKEKRTLSIRVKSDNCRLVKLDNEAFTRILGSIEDKLKMDYNNEMEVKIEQLQKGRTLSQAYDSSTF